MGLSKEDKEDIRRRTYSHLREGAPADRTHVYMHNEVVPLLLKEVERLEAEIAERDEVILKMVRIQLKLQEEKDGTRN